MMVKILAVTRVKTMFIDVYTLVELDTATSNKQLLKSLKSENEKKKTKIFKHCFYTSEKKVGRSTCVL